MFVLFFVISAMGLLAPGRDHVTNATAIATVVLDEPPLFKGDESKVKTAALWVAIGFRESSLRNGVASHTDDHCMMQVHGRSDLALDPELCVRVASALLRESMRACPEHPLAVYAEGPRGCTSARAQRISRDRMAIAARLVREVRP